MYIKVANGDAYDVLVPSDYMIQRMMQEKMLQKLEPETRKECLGELADAIKGLPYDPKNEYSIPYFWGTVGIVYDKTKVSEEDLEKDGWDIFLDQKFKGDIYLYDSERDSFMMALKALGYSMNTTSQDELNDAYNWLIHRQSSSPDPSHHNGTETERSSFHSHLHGNGPSHFVQVQEVCPVERIVQKSFFINMITSGTEKNDGEHDHHHDTGGQCGNSRSQQSHFGHSQFTVNQNIVADNVHYISCQ